MQSGMAVMTARMEKAEQQFSDTDRETMENNGAAKEVGNKCKRSRYKT